MLPRGINGALQQVYTSRLGTQHHEVSLGPSIKHGPVENAMRNGFGEGYCSGQSVDMWKDG